MQYEVLLAPAVERAVSKMDAPIRRHILNDIARLADDPRPHGARKLASPTPLYRIAAGPGRDYRVIYEIEDRLLKVLVVKVGNRKDIYRRLP